jgi:hypothetical protein
MVILFTPSWVAICSIVKFCLELGRPAPLGLRAVLAGFNSFTMKELRSRWIVGSLTPSWVAICSIVKYCIATSLIFSQ